jgi:hypothetical protein
MDRRYRHLEHRYAQLKLESGGNHDRLAAVIRLARERYFAVAHRLAEYWPKRSRGAVFRFVKFRNRVKCFGLKVRLRAREQKTAYLLIDSLRYEMAEELVEGLGDGFDVTLSPALVQFPSITEVGMAALMPGAEDGMGLVDAGGGQVGLRIGDAC